MRSVLAYWRCDEAFQLHACGAALMSRSWNLVADIGGTNARFAVAEPGADRPVQQRALAVADHQSFAAALDSFLAGLRDSKAWDERPRAACLAIAAPVGSDPICMTNADWVIERDACAARLGLDRVEVINDFVAQGYAVPALAGDDLVTLHPGEAVEEAARLVIGPGTGLGVCIALPTTAGWTVLPGEGGHVDLPVTTETEWALLRHLAGRYGHVSAERVLSGPGLREIYGWLAAGDCREVGQMECVPPAEDISAAALAGSDDRAQRSVESFLGLLAAVVGDAALTAGSRGGIYLAGGILPGLRPLLSRGDFRERFLAKGRYRAYLAAMPMHLVVHDQPGLLGALQRLNALQGTAASST